MSVEEKENINKSLRVFTVESEYTNYNVQCFCSPMPQYHCHVSVISLIVPFT